MLNVEFDRTIESSLPPEELWRLIVEAFEQPRSSPVWPLDLEVVELDHLAEGAKVDGTYKIGSLEVEASYRIRDVDPGRAFTYESEPTHPLEGGATVAVEPRAGGKSALHWYGEYEPRRFFEGLAAVTYVRLAFLPTFFSRLEARLRSYEAQWEAVPGDVRRARP